MAALSTFTTGAFFKYLTEKYILSDQTGTGATKLVCYNVNKHQLVELDETTEVDAVTLSQTSTPVFSLT